MRDRLTRESPRTVPGVDASEVSGSARHTLAGYESRWLLGIEQKLLDEGSKAGFLVVRQGNGPDLDRQCRGIAGDGPRLLLADEELFNVTIGTVNSPESLHRRVKSLATDKRSSLQVLTLEALEDLVKRHGG